MIRVLDRLLIYGYIKAYIICLISLLSLYIVVDLFMNVNDFAHANDGLGPFLHHVGIYYAARSTTIFDRLAEMIVLLAAMFTIAWVQRNNELLPQLSAGVSTQRIVRPVLLSACAMLAVTTLNQELVIPRLSYLLALNRDDPNGDRDLFVRSGYEPNQVFIRGDVGIRKDLLVRNFHCNIPQAVARGNALDIFAKEARYIPPDAQGKSRTGGWMLTDAQPAELDRPPPEMLEWIAPGRYFLKVKEVDFDSITRDGRKWFYLAPTWRLYQELGKSDVERLPAMAVLFHIRLTRPLLGMILVFLGLSVILRDQNRNVFISAGLCLVLCATFFAVCFACQQLGDKEFISPALAAWLPVLIFGPMAFVMFDAIHT
jgi:lipopolysaccharide export system permease protein